MLNTTDINVKVRFLVLYQDAKWRATRIAYTLKTPLRTIEDWISKVNQGIDISQVQPGRGAKSTLSESEKQNIKRKVQRKPMSASTRKLGISYEKSKDTIHRVLQEKGMKFQKVQKKVLLDDDQKTERIQYCKKMLKRKGEPLEELFFSDEMGIRLSEAHQSSVWMGPRKKIKVENPARDIKLNCWGAISKNGSTTLHIFKNNMNATFYQEVIQEHMQEMEELYPHGFSFMHDNSSVHIASEPDLEKQGLNLIKFPSYSPDLNPIENLWSALKGRVASDNPRNETELTRSLVRNWDILTEVDNLIPYFDNLYERYQECIDAKGERLSY